MDSDAGGATVVSWTTGAEITTGATVTSCVETSMTCDADAFGVCPGIDPMQDVSTAMPAMTAIADVARVLYVFSI